MNSVVLGSDCGITTIGLPGERDAIPNKKQERNTCGRQRCRKRTLIENG